MKFNRRNFVQAGIIAFATATGLATSSLSLAKPKKKVPIPVMAGPNVDTGVTSLQPQFNLNLILEGKEIGQFWFDEETQSFKFEGNVDDSARVFVDTVNTYFSHSGMKWHMT